MERKLRKASASSDSLIVTIPKHIVDEMNLSAKDALEIKKQGDKKIIIEIQKR